MFLEIFPSGPLQTNAILLGCRQTKQGAFIDAPFNSSSHQMERAHALSLQIEACLLTHSHWDHIAEAAVVKNLFHIPLYIHPDDAPNLIAPGSDNLPYPIPIQGVEPDHFLQDGAVIPIGQLRLHVIHTPGHSPGGVCFYIEEEKILFAGDTLFKGAFGSLSLPTARPHLMRPSLKKLAALPKETRVIPGHGSETTIGSESWLFRS